MQINTPGDANPRNNKANRLTTGGCYHLTKQ